MSTTPERRKNTWLIVVLAAAAVLLLCGCIVAIVLALTVPAASRTISTQGVFGRVEATTEVARSFGVSIPATLNVDNEVGKVRIEGGSGEEIAVRAVVHGYGRTTEAAQAAAEDVTVSITQNGDGAVRVECDIPAALQQGQSPTVDLTITVPRETNVLVRNNVGNLEVRHVSGSFDVTTDVGEIDTADITLTGDSKFRANVGEMRIGLPADVAVNLDASTGVGEIESDFVVQGAEAPGMGVSRTMQGTIGENPTIDLELHTGTGEIRIIAE
ncbi:MAG: DUF4097 family beta strand repeat-containing protein [Anaerolineae bacterium]